MDKTNAQKLILENLSKMRNLKTSLNSSTIKIKLQIIQIVEIV